MNSKPERGHSPSPGIAGGNCPGRVNLLICKATCGAWKQFRKTLFLDGLQDKRQADFAFAADCAIYCLGMTQDILCAFSKAFRAADNDRTSRAEGFETFEN